MSDSKATDVAYDSGNKKSKRTAEVKIEGGVYFEFIRVLASKLYSCCLYISWMSYNIFD